MSNQVSAPAAKKSFAETFRSRKVQRWLVIFTFMFIKIEVGGKTGTAEAGEKTNAWFVGFAPYENPEIAVVVFIENGEHGSYSAEVTRDIMEAYFGLNEEIKEDKTAKPYVNN